MQFYLIRSKASVADSKGVQKFSFACETGEETFLFLWLGSEKELVHLQWVFDEQVLSWKPTQGFEFGLTNRHMAVTSQLGRQKGSRTLNASGDSEAMQRAMQQLRKVQLPPDFQQHLARLID